MTEPLLSIIIPTFNAGERIGSALHSILYQTFNDYEIIVVDGLSTDETIHVVEQLSNKNQNIRLKSEKDNGVYDAMNKGIQMATGKWIYFLGADDQLYGSDTLKKIFELPAIGHHNVIYGNVKIVGDTSWAKDGEVYDGEFSLQKLLAKNICHQCIFYKRDFVNKTGYYNVDYKLCADWDYNLRCWAQSSFLYINTIVAYFSAGGESTKTNSDMNFHINYLKNVMSYFQLSPFHPLMDDVTFPFYFDILRMQRETNYPRYLFNRMKNKF